MVFLPRTSGAPDRRFTACVRTAWHSCGEGNSRLSSDRAVFESGDSIEARVSSVMVNYVLGADALGAMALPFSAAPVTNEVQMVRPARSIPGERRHGLGIAAQGTGRDT